MINSELPAPEPVVTPETKSFWDATTDQRIVLQRCANCHAVIWYPRGICPECSHLALLEFESAGRGTIYSFTVNHRGEGPYRESAPYVLAYVELDEGPRLLTNIVGVDPADDGALRIGLPVRAVFSPASTGSSLVRFAPA